MALHLRVFPESLDETYLVGCEPTVKVRLGDLLPLLAIAKRQNYLWLHDFIDDEVCVTPDLYEVLRAFNGYRKGA